MPTSQSYQHKLLFILLNSFWEINYYFCHLQNIIWLRNGTAQNKQTKTRLCFYRFTIIQNAPNSNIPKPESHLLTFKNTSSMNNKTNRSSCVCPSCIILKTIYSRQKHPPTPTSHSHPPCYSQANVHAE